MFISKVSSEVNVEKENEYECGGIQLTSASPLEQPSILHAFLQVVLDYTLWDEKM